MKRTRATSLLFAVATGGLFGPAIAGQAIAVAPTPDAIQPRVLATGAPACGNVTWKTPIEPDCAAAHAAGRVIVQSVLEQSREIGRILAVLDGFPDRALTVAEVRRPRS